jgi:hypothetical protein
MNPLPINLDPQHLADFCRKWKIAELSLFGSVLRDDFGPESDVDFLVTFEPNDQWSLWDLNLMQSQLEGLIGRKADLIEKKSIRNPYFRDRVLSTHRVLYAA